MEKRSITYETTGVPDNLVKAIEEEGFTLTSGWMKHLDNEDYFGKLIYPKGERQEGRATGNIQTTLSNKAEMGYVELTVFTRTKGCGKL